MKTLAAFDRRLEDVFSGCEQSKDAVNTNL
jgi:hypothetical protein